MPKPIDVVEALLFASDVPLEAERIREVLDLEDVAAAQALVGELIARYEADDRGLAIMEVAGIDVPVEPVSTVRPPGGADRPLNGVLSCRRARESGLPVMRPWREALEEYMARAGLSAGAGAAVR